MWRSRLWCYAPSKPQGTLHNCWGIAHTGISLTSTRTLHWLTHKGQPLCHNRQDVIFPHLLPYACRWVPKLARKYVKPDDICFSDVTQYDPRLLEQAPYRLPITSTVPLLADKVRSLCLCVQLCRHMSAP